jgi:hypothetical protein
LTPYELASAAIDMDLVLEREPRLGDFGFGVRDPRSKTPEERAVGSTSRPRHGGV